MKKFLTLALIAGIALVSCSKSDGDTQDGQNDINQLIGEWKLQSETENGNNLLNDCNKQDSYVFKSDKTYTRIHYSVDGTGCKKEEGYGFFSIKGNQLTFINGKTGTEETGNFSVKENILTLSNGGYIVVYDKVQNPLIGTWDIQTKTINGSIQALSDCKKKETLVFTEKTINRIESEMQNGVCTSLGDDIATYVISDNKLIETDEGESEEFTFYLNHNILTMTLVEQDNNVTITTITTYQKR